MKPNLKWIPCLAQVLFVHVRARARINRVIEQNDLALRRESHRFNFKKALSVSLTNLYVSRISKIMILTQRYDFNVSVTRNFASINVK